MINSSAKVVKNNEIYKLIKENRRIMPIVD